LADVSECRQLLVSLTIMTLLTFLFFYLFSSINSVQPLKNGIISSHALKEVQVVQAVGMHSARRSLSSLRSSEKKCERYAFVKGPSAGLGHMFSRVVLTYIYALEKNASPLIDKNIFKEKGPHGSYSWSLDYLGLNMLKDIGEIVQEENNSTSVPMQKVNEFVWTANPKKELNTGCNIVYQTCDLCCYRDVKKKPRWCQMVKNKSFSVARDFFLGLRKSDKIEEIPKVLQDYRVQGYVDIVWHVRTGDINLENNLSRVFTHRLIRTLRNIFVGEKLKILVLSEKKNKKYSRLFRSLEARFLKLDAMESLKVMVHCSVLVTSGSSFSALATMYKSKKTLAFQPTPKEGKINFYDIYEQAFVDNFGKVTSPDLYELKERAKVIIENLNLYRFF
jgi:hypothetical protein